MISRQEKSKGRKEAHEALERAKALVKERQKNKDTAGPFYKDGCMIYCSKEREAEVREKFNIGNDEPIQRLHPIKKYSKSNGKN